MIEISEADWFSRRVGTCRPHAIWMNQFDMWMPGEIVKYRSGVASLAKSLSDVCLWPLAATPIGDSRGGFRG